MDNLSDMDPCFPFDHWLQVQAAIHESTPKQAGAKPTSAPAPGTGPPLAEGTEVPLLYVRFRAAAEPSLKGG